LEAVLKIGGSLAEEPKILVELCKELGSLAKVHKMAIVPGGGELADIVRLLDRRFGLSERVAHEMAILAMDQFGLLLSDFIPNSYAVSSFEKIDKPSFGMLPIFLPSKELFCKDPFEPSWDVTSDAIAAYVAHRLCVKKLILVTNVDGIFPEDPRENSELKHLEKVSARELINWNKKTSVDKHLPKILLQKKLNCYVVNGKCPKRIKLLLENRQTISTHIIV
jgi:aspartokinase-like uncharacterized kinase